MIDVNRLKGEFKANGYSQGEVAKMLGIAEQTLSVKLKKGVLNSNEIDAMIDILNIKDPMSIFFVQQVAR